MDFYSTVADSIPEQFPSDREIWVSTFVFSIPAHLLLNMRHCGLPEDAVAEIKYFNICALISCSEVGYILCILHASVVYWSEFLAADTEVPGSISGATRFSEEHWVWNRVHSALVRINDELLERQLAAPS
jgi:hypothetical protein